MRSEIFPSLWAGVLLAAAITAAAEPGADPARNDSQPLRESGPTLDVERAGARAGGEAVGGTYHLVLTSAIAASTSSGGAFDILPGLDPGGESGEPWIFADGFESGDVETWSLAVGAARAVAPSTTAERSPEAP